MATRKKKRSVRDLLYKGEYFDYTLLLVVLFLVAFGLVMVYSTSSYKSITTYGNAYHWLLRQGIFAMFGIGAMLFISNMDYHVFKRFTVPLWFSMWILQVLVMIIGIEVNGSKRWLGIGSFSVQPSEIAKMSLVLVMAHCITVYLPLIGKFKSLFMFFIISAGPVIALVGVENMSTSLILFAIAGVMVFVAVPGYKQFATIIGCCGALVAILLMSQSYRIERIQIFLDPTSTPKGYQTLQALYAIGSGGIFGKGLGQSMQKMGFIPEAYNDMIFSVVCEELGLFGALAVIALVLILIYRCVIVAYHAPDLYGSLIVIGVMSHISIQMLINMMVVTKTIPPTGVPLPFISYGGTSIVFLLVEVGLVLSVSRHIRLSN